MGPMLVKFYPDPLRFARVIREKPILSKYVLRCHAYRCHAYAWQPTKITQTKIDISQKIISSSVAEGPRDMMSVEILSTAVKKR